jgi:16S rRNA (guanine527-N7)-methyltransferase
MLSDSLQARLWTGARSLGLELAKPQLESYGQYLEMLREWNRRFNLTAIEAPEEIIDKHFVDSLSCSLAIEFSSISRLVDVGTGAGFPGMVLKIAFPHLHVLLLDAVDKRLRFLQRVAEELQLTGIEILHARAEDAGRDLKWRERADVVVSRAVSRLSTLAEYCLPLARVGGSFLAQKGPQVTDELAEARTAIDILGGGEATVRTLVLPGSEIGRSLLLVPKTRPTPPIYPRRTGTPKKHPL